jgi:hypothetical protein
MEKATNDDVEDLVGGTDRYRDVYDGRECT